jgi:hypothetical protein
MFIFVFALILGESVTMGVGEDLGVIAAPGKAPAGRSMTLHPGERLTFQVAETATGGGSSIRAVPQERGTIRKPARVPAISALVLGTSDWHAWLNKMPPGPASFHVTGTVTLPTRGYDVSLSRSSPQGSDLLELILDLVVTRQPGTWPRQATQISVRYDDSNVAVPYKKVRIRWPGGTPVSLAVDEVY